MELELIEYWMSIMPEILVGIQSTLIMTGTAVLISSTLAIFLSLGRMYGPKPISFFCKVYIEFFRGTPLLAQLFIIYFGLPSWGINLDSFTSAVLAFGLNSGAYVAEYLRGAIQSIDQGQMKAAYSLGMSKFSAFRRIILPQAIRLVIPPWSNDVIYTLKYTSIAFLVGAQELMSKAKIIASWNFRFIDTFVLVAIIYLILVLILTILFNRLERRLEIPGYEMTK